ncbi:MAG TPA: GMC family oxidoreductase [Opitutales bacterium]|nr:GMC family oxidoreductase [Opitutales bacterium]
MSSPLQPHLHDTACALAYSLAANLAEPGRPELAPPYNDLADFILREEARMPDYLRGPVKLATLGFDLAGWLTLGTAFHRAAPAQRAKLIRAWKNAATSAQRDFVRFHESLTALALHSRALPNLAPRETEGPADAVVREPPGQMRCEILVVGSGPGGSITAALLAEAGRAVLMVEEGPYLALESCAPFSRQEMEQKYRNGGLTVALGQTKIAYVEGRCVGGGSEINSGLYHRTPPDILEAWRKEFQVKELAEADLQKHFEACEKDLSVSPWPGELPAASQKLRDGARKLGWQSQEVPRWFRYEAGAGGRGERQSMTRTYVPRFLRAGGKLLPNTRVLRLRRENGRWLAQAGHASGKIIELAAENLFLAAGAVHTPALLRRSGLTRNIGENLRLHPTIKLTAQFQEPVNSADLGVPAHQVKEFSPRLSFGCSVSTPPYLALGLLDHPAAARAVPTTWTRQANYYAMITGQGSGHIRVAPGFRDPLVRYRLAPVDQRDLADGVRKLAEMMLAAGAECVFPGVAGWPALVSADDLRRLPEVLPPGRASLITIHLFSSCPMGENRAKCATDSFGRVHGAENLFVADASLLCTAPGVNPQGSIMAIARRNALHFLQQDRP